MKVRLNGKEAELEEGATVADAVRAAGIPTQGSDPEPGRGLTRGQTPAVRGVAVAVDGEVVPAAEWGTVELADDTTVEVVHAVQGG